MNSACQLYKSCRVVGVKFCETKYYDKKLYFMHVNVLVAGKIRTLYFPQGDNISEIKSRAESYYRGEMKYIDVCRCFVTLEQKYFVRDLQTGNICRDESGNYIQVDKYPIYAGVYLDDNNSYSFIDGNDRTSQCDQLKKRGVLVLSVDNKLPPQNNIRELSSDELLK